MFCGRLSCQILLKNAKNADFWPLFGPPILGLFFGFFRGFWIHFAILIIFFNFISLKVVYFIKNLVCTFFVTSYFRVISGPISNPFMDLFLVFLKFMLTKIMLYLLCIYNLPFLNLIWEPIFIFFSRLFLLALSFSLFTSQLHYLWLYFLNLKDIFMF